MAMNNNYKNLFQGVLEEEAKALNMAKGKISDRVVDSLIQLFDFLRINQGSLIFCGVGKSGLIAQKIAATFTSLGQNSWFLHPTEALHGDMGRVRSQDVMVLISKSGTTEEIVKMFPFIPLKKDQLIALCGNSDSEIVKKCHLFIDCTVEKEACTNNLAPTTSSTLTLALGDAMAVVYEAWVGLSKEGFAKNHPAGFLGKSLLLKVESLMLNKSECPVVAKTTKMKDVLLAMTTYPTGLCSVTDNHGKLLGIVVEGDMRRHLPKYANFLEQEVSVIMNTKPKTISPLALAYDALNIMELGEKQISVMPVVNNEGEFLGILRLHDLLKSGLSSAK